MFDTMPKNDERERDIAADREMCEAATPGPWVRGKPTDAVISKVPDGSGITSETRDYYGGTVICESAFANDLKFITESRTALPYWMDRCEAAEARVTKLEKGYKFFRDVAFELAAQRDHASAMWRQLWI